MDNKNLYRYIPKIDMLLENVMIKELIDKTSRELVLDVIRQEIEKIRTCINSGGSKEKVTIMIDSIVQNIRTSLKKVVSCKYKKVINGTGTVIHTNLGRSVISERIAKKASEIISGYSNLEYNLETGLRGSRYSHFEKLLCKITGAEAAIVVNNNAAAVLLVLNTLAKDKEVVVSRGELVEIGGSFRVPDVMIQSGAKLVEIGTTNKTHIKDYEEAINEDTGVLLKVHTSNYKVVGFSESVSVENVAKLGKSRNVPVVEDIGSGVLIDLSEYGLTYEPTVQQSIKQGADIVSFSGDKLLGGPQAGIIVGKKDYIDKMKKNPLTRAFRIDKLTVSILESVLLEYLDKEKAVQNIPTLNMITQPISKIEKRAAKLVGQLNVLVGEYCNINIEDCYSQVGGGSLPLERIPSKSVVVFSDVLSSAKIERKLRHSEIPVITRITNDRIVVDMRTVNDDEIKIICENFRKIFTERG